MPDECDQPHCPAWALETWISQEGGMLRFCHHHSVDNGVQLRRRGFWLFEVEKVPA